MMPDHPVWNELESYFGTSITPREKQTIVELIQRTMAENPDIDLNELTLRAADMVVRGRG